MTTKHVSLIGATGLIGHHLLHELIADPAFETITIIARRPLNLQHPKVQVKVVDFDDATAFKAAIAGSMAVFCTVGTTNKKVKGDKTAYRKVDYDIPAHAAQYLAESGGTAFLMVSAVGANAKSRNFYLKLKAEAEAAVINSGVTSVHIFRPSMLLGQRAEFSLGELFGITLTRPMAFLMPPNYKPIQGQQVAKAMVKAAKNPETGVTIWHFKNMMTT